MKANLHIETKMAKIYLFIGVIILSSSLHIERKKMFLPIVLLFYACWPFQFQKKEEKCHKRIMAVAIADFSF